MNKFHFLSLCALGTFGAVILGACSTSQNYHSIACYSPADGFDVLYADDTDDTIQIATTDSWTASTSYDWITIDSATTKGSVSYVYGAICISPIYVTTKVNESSEIREGVVSVAVSGADDFSRNLGVILRQLPVLNISSAVGSYANAEKTKVCYQQVDSANQVTDTLIFNTRRSWKLSVPNPTVIAHNPGNAEKYVQPLTTQGTGGYTKVPLNITKNTSTEGDTLKTILYLESSGVTTPVTFLQYPKKNQ